MDQPVDDLEDQEEGEHDLSEEMLSGDALDEHLDDLEEEEMMRDGLKMPKGLVGGEDDEYDDELDEEGSQQFGEQDDEPDEAVEEQPDKDYDVEDEVFAMARENAEMDN